MVQGVGFRFSARELALRYRIRGSVENLNDGRVKLLAEGQEGDLESFLRELKDKFSGYIGDCLIREQTVSGDHNGFRIKLH